MTPARPCSGVLILPRFRGAFEATFELEASDGRADDRVGITGDEAEDLERLAEPFDLVHADEGTAEEGENHVAVKADLTCDGLWEPCTQFPRHHPIWEAS